MTSLARPAGHLEDGVPRVAEDLMRALVEFHLAYGCPMRLAPTARPDEYVLRLELLREEYEEYVTAASVGDVVEVADALADMAYVIFGTALAYGIDLPAVLAEVHRSNMSKLGADGRPLYREDGKVLKGPAFSPPDIATALWPAAPERELCGDCECARDDHSPAFGGGCTACGDCVGWSAP